MSAQRHEAIFAPQQRFLIEHLVSGGQQAVRYGDAKSIGSLAIDHQFKFGWQLNGKVGGLVAF
jgi:hypothetical protein